MIDPTQVRARLDAVIAAMKRTASWDIARPPDTAFSDMGAFGMNTMAFEQWLRFVFVPNVEKLLAANGPWPGSSQVSVQATREGDTSVPIAELVPALRAFDELFGDDDDDDDYDDDDEAPKSRALQASERSEAAFERGDHAAATAAIDEAIGLDPALHNAHNFAGWILVNTPSRSSAQLDAAIAHFRAALDVEAHDSVAAANLCDALVAAGREKDAVAEAKRLGAHNWLGVHWLGNPETHAQSLEQLQLATRSRPSSGLVHANLANALEVAHRSGEAWEEHACALGCNDDFDRAFSHERRGAYEARQGWLRNALRSFRAALREDNKTGGAREKTYREAIEWMEGQLRAQGIEVAPPDRDLTNEKWLRACEVELPAGLGARNEAGEPLADDVVEVERLVRAERWQDVVKQLEALQAADIGKLVDALGYAERGAQLARRAGHRDEAIAMMRLVVAGYRAYVSWSTAAGEAYGRMHDADERQRTLSAWEREGS